MPTVADRSMGLGLKALRTFASLDVVDRVGLRGPSERVIYEVSKGSFRGAAAASRTFKTVQGLNGSARQKPSSGGKGLFDLTPDEDQQMLIEVVRELAANDLRPAALDADAALKAPDAVLTAANDMGVGSLGVPEELGGYLSERSAVTGVLVAETLGHGDVGLTVAALSTGAVATALGLYGDSTQQGTYLPALVGEDAPAAAFALLEPHPVFDPFALKTTARRSGDGWVLDGVKAMVPRGAEAELFLVAAALEDGGNGLFLVESSTPGIGVVATPAMGVRAAGLSQLVLADVAVGEHALLGEGSAEVYADAVQRARIAWCAVSVGCMKAVLDYVIPYVKERTAFGEPVAYRQSVAFAISDIAIEYEGLRLATLRAASRADQGKPFARETAIARRLAAKHAMTVGSAGVQLLGGHGYVKEHPVERWYRDLRAAGVFEGALLV